ncbi:efflux system, membrane fusion protein [Sulfurimonas gotlandica GD1]|jgi:RND family efflux transporter MFP subunit|uniref:Efflux system, membrane fusion protein n=1 Tax=Sulfurimonas gotlandica (strain DSM 19862 / JCM 16533 / GD1) TaxID=929558 RepID=B6BJL5_SULGG|nr:efflux RND transporter periplasmic adaptor subunit [Sulfurimonas gotlandica]EDZ62698.1 HlyD family secretion protein [Sulfurimonas gotlandica GD1]EHP31260.1 efflux system, membrane fusion protein [Sulfurimonas gotlandica GD1]
MKTKLISTILLSSLFLFSSCSDDKPEQVQKEMPPLSVNTITVKKEPIPIWKQYTGTTKASSDQEVRARVPGILKKIYFKDGDTVIKGQKLFMIEQDEYIAARDAAKAKKAQDEASLKLANADVARYEPLVKEGLAPRATLEQYQAQQAGLKAAIAGDVAEIKKAQLSLSYTMIRAPISGKASARRVDIGNLVGQGESTLLTTIMSVDPIYTYFSPSQNDVRLFEKYRNKEKPVAFIEINSQRETIRLDGYVDFSNNVVDSLTSTISMRATISNPDGKVLPGTFVYVNLFINDKYSFLMIPPEVIFSDQLGTYVYVVDKDNKVKRADIETDYSTKYYVSVKTGLQDGDRVIVSALVKLKPGRAIKATDVSSTHGIKAVLEKNKLIPKSK